MSRSAQASPGPACRHARRHTTPTATPAPADVSRGCLEYGVQRARALCVVNGQPRQRRLLQAGELPPRHAPHLCQGRVGHLAQAVDAAALGAAALLPASVSGGSSRGSSICFKGLPTSWQGVAEALSGCSGRASGELLGRLPSPPMRRPGSRRTSSCQGCGGTQCSQGCIHPPPGVAAHLRFLPRNLIC